jgi:receptor protein-tyrosine kinase
MINPNTQPALSDREEFRMLDCLHALYRRRKALLLATAAGALAAALLSLAAPRTYRSSVSMEIQGINENFSNTGSVLPAGASGGGDWNAYVQTQVEMLQQEPLLERVVANLKLADRPEFRHGPALARENAVSVLKKSLQVVPGHGSRIVRILADSRDPKLAAQIADNLAQSFIEENVQSRRAAAKQIYDALNIQLDTLRQRLHASESQLVEGERGGRRASTSALKRDIEADRKSYDSISQKVNDSWIASAVGQSNVRIVSAARVPSRPYKPNLPFNVGIGAIGGLVLCVGFVMFREQSSPTVRMPGEAAVSLSLPELGVIPLATGPGFGKFGLVPWRSKNDQAERIPWGGSSPMSESFRATLSSILSPDRAADCARILVVTSSVPMEGKTTVVGNLGISLTEIGKRVLLIDGDLRRPRLHKMFDEPNSWGLSDILREKNGIEELPLDAITRKTSVPHLYLLPSGAPVENVFGLLWSGRLARLLPRFRSEFDYVLLDAPPCLEFADARIMARHADQLLLVVRANSTDRRTVQAAVQRLLLDGIPMMGVILNGCDPARDGQYRYAGNEFIR